MKQQLHPLPLHKANISIFGIKLYPYEINISSIALIFFIIPLIFNLSQSIRCIDFELYDIDCMEGSLSVKSMRPLLVGSSRSSSSPMDLR